MRLALTVQARGLTLRVPQMSGLSLVERYLLNLGGGVPEDALIYVDRDYARKRLQEMIGQDFGYDAKQWEEWLEPHPEILAMYHFGPTLRPTGDGFTSGDL